FCIACMVVLLAMGGPGGVAYGVNGWFFLYVVSLGVVNAGFIIFAPRGGALAGCGFRPSRAEYLSTGPMHEFLSSICR
ncbi:hypothetical protein, partial [Nocardia abscessus]|uniref:hypothetical protein n=1 Tax=Nocardia abscessus TaxID=120957 RepID=UPI002456C646